MFNIFKKKLKPDGDTVNLSKRTLVCLVLDESGSMVHLTKDTIGGVNNFMDSFKQDHGDEVLFSFYTFDSAYDKIPVRTVYSHTPIQKVEHISSKTYRPAGGTPLYDAVGQAIRDMRKEAKDGELVIFAILTDGAENSSREYNAAGIKQDIQALEKKGWKFSFLGVGLDAFSAYQNMGASLINSFNLGASGQAISNTYGAMAANSVTMRSAYTKSGIQATADLNVILDKDRNNIN